MSEIFDDDRHTGFVGLTHMGIVASVCWAHNFSPIIGFDSDNNRIQQLNGGNTPVEEPRLQDLLNKNSSRLTYTTDFTLLSKCGYVFITQDISTDDDNRSDYESFFGLVNTMIPNLLEGVVLILMSQVSVGTCSKLNSHIRNVRPALHFELIYMVETLIFGKAIDRFLHPERIILGTSSGSSEILDKYANLKSCLEGFEAPILAMKYESAELTKLAINLFLFNSVIYANTIADLCEAYSADINEIIPALRLDKRIGKYAYIQPSLGIAGGNIGRDMMTLMQLEKDKGIVSDYIELSMKLNKDRYKWVTKQLNARLFSKISKPRIAIWGLAYKRDTNSTKNSMALKIISELLNKAGFTAYDPIVKSFRGSEIVEICSDRYDAIDGAHCLIIFTDPDEFSKIDLIELESKMKNTLILDCVNSYPFLKDEEGIEYVAIGR